MDVEIVSFIKKVEMKIVEWDNVKEDLLLGQEVKKEYEKIPDPYFEGEYIYFKDENGFEWPMYVGVDLANDEDKSICDYPTQPMQPIKQTKWKHVLTGLAYSTPIWIAAAFVLWAVGKGRWW